MASSLFVSPRFLSHPVIKSNYSTTSQPSNLPPPLAAVKVPKLRVTKAAIDANGSTCTRRFGIGAGLVLVGFQAFGAVSQQIQTRLQVPQQDTGTGGFEEKEEEVVFPNGIRYYDLNVGHGASPGDMAVINVKGRVHGNGQLFVDTSGGDRKNKAVGVVMRSRPHSEGICEGVEYVIRNMKADGKTRVIIAPSLGFGEKGADFGEGLQIPQSAALEYVVEVCSVTHARNLEM